MIGRTRILPQDPLSATIEIEHASVARRGAWHTRLNSRSRVTCTPTGFRVEAEIEALEGDSAVFRRSWDERIARRGL